MNEFEIGLTTRDFLYDILEKKRKMDLVSSAIQIIYNETDHRGMSELKTTAIQFLIKQFSIPGSKNE
jgi:hypothetical protein